MLDFTFGAIFCGPEDHGYAPTPVKKTVKATPKKRRKVTVKRGK